MNRVYNFLSRCERRKLRSRKKLHNAVAKRLRISIFKSNKHFYVQLIDDEKRVTIISASTLDQKIKDACNSQVNANAIKHVAALMIERLAHITLHKKVLFDRGPYKYTGLISQFAETLRRSGLEF
ncbi:50S ribosomal protein L18 [Wolbachia endosymbiont of Howardula sp.]|uniref:50S ribosomal protein L18 n=1 Tax=Wolbachia endosymbiont of Howardula sp. TaxID=2916816 RepID=UPI00217EFC7A|nr:50S ribosomal protein L18 [Wolbachia endosymbiont of Howardula sp.]UWI83155.1 50S ribosomal protein L18 [Wolbachia endosymbiont of Howardula sp.]